MAADKEATLLLKIKTAGQDAISGVGSMLKGVGAIATIAFGAAAAAGKVILDNYREQELAVNKLNSSLVQQGIYSKSTSDSYLKMASALQEVSQYGDEQIVGAQAIMQAQLGQTKITKELMKATLDFASAQDMDLASAAQAVSKSIGTNTNALARYGIEIDTNATKSEKLAAITQGLSGKFDGQAEAMVGGLGVWKKAQNAFSDVLEVLGEKFAPAIIYAGEETLKFIKTFDTNIVVNFFQNILKLVPTITASLFTIIDATNGIGGALGAGSAPIASFFSMIYGYLKMIMSPMIALQNAFIQLYLIGYDAISGLVSVLSSMTSILSDPTKAFSDMKDGVASASEDMKGRILSIKDGFVDMKNSMVVAGGEIIDSGKEIWNSTSESMELAKEAFNEAGDSITARWDTAAKQIDELNKKMVSNAEESRKQDEALTVASHQRKQQIDAEAAVLKLEAFSTEKMAALEQELALELMREQALAGQLTIYNQAQIDAETNKNKKLQMLAANQVAFDKAQAQVKMNNLTGMAKFQAMLQTEEVKNYASTFSQISSLQSAHNKGLATIGKAAAMAQITISTAEGIAKAWSFGPFLGPVLSGLVAVAGAAQAAKVAGVQLAEGGIVKATSGGVPAIIGEGGQDEAVIPLGDNNAGLGGTTVVINVGAMMGSRQEAEEFAKIIDNELFNLRKTNQSRAFDSGLV